ncbi:MAG: hypothetical protein P4L71_02190 [Acetobacteraceae bacterium]|nr:hypothetical protein [Acetobacteraceae bacterium]
MVQRRWSTLVGRMAGLSQVRVPVERIERVNQALRRRLDDAVDQVFRQACLNGDLDTAKELLAVLVSMHDRRQEKFGSERRISDDTVRRAQEELARRLREGKLPAPDLQSRS